LCQPPSYATGGWHSRLYTSRNFIREIRVIRGQKSVFQILSRTTAERAVP